MVKPSLINKEQIWLKEKSASCRPPMRFANNFSTLLIRGDVFDYDNASRIVISSDQTFSGAAGDRSGCRASRGYCRSTSFPKRSWSGDRFRRRRRTRQGKEVAPVYMQQARR